MFFGHCPSRFVMGIALTFAVGHAWELHSRFSPILTFYTDQHESSPIYLKLYSKCFISTLQYIGISTEVFQTSELHPGDPQHTQEEPGRSSSTSVCPITTGLNRAQPYLYSLLPFLVYGLHLLKFVHTNLPRAMFEPGSLGSQAGCSRLNHPCLIFHIN